ncbi:MAG: hypothetical protein ABIP55_10785 [Tepidisphaeraceae bacterium]
MKKIKGLFRLVVTLLLIGGWALAASALHVVNTGDWKKPVIIPKQQLGVVDTYICVKDWTANDVASHPVVVKRLIATGRADVLANAFKPATGDELVTLVNDAVTRGPTTQPAPAVAPAEPKVVDEKPAHNDAAAASVEP